MTVVKITDEHNGDVGMIRWYLKSVLY